MVSRDVLLLFLTRTVRLFAYGTIGVILALYLSAVGLSNQQLGILLTLTLVGDSVISLGVTSWADRMGRRRMLVWSCLLMVLAGAVYGELKHPSFAVLLVAAIVGVLSPSGNEVGPFMALEQSILSELVGPSARAHVFAWYNLVGYSMTALGAAAAGNAVTFAHARYGVQLVDSCRAVFLQYGAAGAVLLLLFLLLSEQVELAGVAGAGRPTGQSACASVAVPAAAADAADSPAAGEIRSSSAAVVAGEEEFGNDLEAPLLGSSNAERPDGEQQEGHQPASTADAAAAADYKPTQGTSTGRGGLSPRTRRIVAGLSLLFSLDSFAGGLVTGTLLAYYFKVRFGVSTAYLGNLLFGANMIAAASSLLSGYVAARFGLINTMVFTHLPSNLLMLAVPLMPTAGWATAMVFARFSISQMDVAPRSAYVAGVVPPRERTAAMGAINIAKSLGAAAGPVITGWLADRGLFAWAFYGCGGLKIVYDLALLASFSAVHPEH